MRHILIISKSDSHCGTGKAPVYRITINEKNDKKIILNKNKIWKNFLLLIDCKKSISNVERTGKTRDFMYYVICDSYLISLDTEKKLMVLSWTCLKWGFKYNFQMNDFLCGISLRRGFLVEGLTILMGFLTFEWILQKDLSKEITSQSNGSL